MREKPPGVKRIAALLLPAAALAFAAALVLRDRLPPKGLILEALSKNRSSRRPASRAFEVTREKVDYVVTPLYGYELWGLIVSQHDASSFIDISHKAGTISSTQGRLRHLGRTSRPASTGG